MSVGEQREVQLPGLGTAGYVWDSDITGNADVIEVQWTRGDPPGSPAHPPGQSAPDVATIRAVGPGHVELQLYQHRSWEPPSAAVGRHHVVVHVEGNQSR